MEPKHVPGKVEQPFPLDLRQKQSHVPSNSKIRPVPLPVASSKRRAILMRTTDDPGTNTNSSRLYRSVPSTEFAGSPGNPGVHLRHRARSRCKRTCREHLRRADPFDRKEPAVNELDVSLSSPNPRFERSGVALPFGGDIDGLLNKRPSLVSHEARVIFVVQTRLLFVPVFSFLPEDRP